MDTLRRWTTESGSTAPNLSGVAFTAAEGRAQILDDLGGAIDQIGLAVACLAEAYEGLDDLTAERLEDELFRPVQRAYGRAKRTHSQFAERCGLPGRAFESPSAGLASQGVRLLVERAVNSSSDGGRRIAALQDSMLPIEVGDAELRAGLAEARELVEELPGRAQAFMRTLGR